MARQIPKNELAQHKEEAISQLSSYLDALIEAENPTSSSKADKLSYWLKDWTTFLEFESSFSPKSLRRYKRGEIIKAHLGFNVGSEEGGLHYCVVLDKNNSKNSPVLTVVPLTSVKNKTDVNHLHKGCVYLGNELFTNLNSKITFTQRSVQAQINELKDTLNESEVLDTETQQRIEQELYICSQNIELIKRMKMEVSKMKMGSIALIGQIKTISKIRIYDPKTNFDILSHVKLSNEKLDLIDAEIISNFTGKN